jgi:hypothetical protein
MYISFKSSWNKQPSAAMIPNKPSHSGSSSPNSSSSSSSFSSGSSKPGAPAVTLALSA